MIPVSLLILCQNRDELVKLGLVVPKASPGGVGRHRRGRRGGRF